MPPKVFVAKGKRKPAASAATDGGEEASGAVAAGGAGGPAEAAAAAASSAAAGGAGGPAPDSAVSAATAAAAAALSDDGAAALAHLLEALPGEEHQQRLMAEAMAALSISTSTYASKIHPNTRAVAVSNLTVILKGKELLLDSELKLAYGSRYCLVGSNGCGKSILLTLIGKRMVPLPANLDLYHLATEIEPSDMPALAAVTAVDVERTRLLETIASLEELVTGEDSVEQTQLSDCLCDMYERAEEMGAADAEAKAASILRGLGFTAEAMTKRCRDFSGGWRMRIALARALFVHPTCLLLDEPTAHLDMEAVVWLERYLAAYKGILLIVTHSQDVMNNVCTDTIRMFGKKL